MPTDPATTRFINSRKGKVFFEVGSGFRGYIVLPALQEGAKVIYATDIVEDDLCDESLYGRWCKQKIPLISLFMPATGLY